MTPGRSRRALSSAPRPLAARARAQSLMKHHDLQYTVKPVASHADVYAQFDLIRDTLVETVRSVLLLNCGGMLDLTDERCRVDVANDSDPLGQKLPLELYVLDSNRPFSLENVHGETDFVYVVDDALSPADVGDLVGLREVLADAGENAPEEEDSDDEAPPLDDGDGAESERAEQRRRLNDGRYATLSPNSRRGFRREVRQHLAAYARGSWCVRAGAPSAARLPAPRACARREP